MIVFAYPNFMVYEVETSSRRLLRTLHEAQVLSSSAANSVEGIVS